jgi:hypothetical protein
MRRPKDLDDDALVTTVDELVMRHASGGRFRLVRLLYTRPATTPDQVAGQWPLIIEACWATDPGRREALIHADGMGGDSYGARPGDQVAVIPVHPAQAARTLAAAAGVGAR